MDIDTTLNSAENVIPELSQKTKTGTQQLKTLLHSSNPQIFKQFFDEIIASSRDLLRNNDPRNTLV